VTSAAVAPPVQGYSYFEVYGQPWALCTLRSTVTIQNSWNLLDVTLQPAVQLNIGDHLVFEFPVRAFDSLSGQINLFDNDAQRKDFDIVPNDIVEWSSTIQSMTCRYYAGKKDMMQPVRIVCSNFLNSVGTAVAFATAERLRFFFSVTNPLIEVRER
jgi:hypothetical protein